jgi:hypothetical protein
MAETKLLVYCIGPPPEYPEEGLSRIDLKKLTYMKLQIMFCLNYLFIFVFVQRTR